MNAPPISRPPRCSRPLIKLAAGIAFLLILAAVTAGMIHWIINNPQQAAVHFPSLPPAKNAPAPDLIGQIINQQGQPVAGARVNEIPGNDNGPGNQIVRSDATGHFLIGKQRTGESRLVVTAHGYAPELRILEIGDRADPVQLTLAAGRALHGHLKDQSGAPLPGANISIAQWRGAGGLLSIGSGVNAQGDFTLYDVPTDGFTISAAKNGYGATTLNIAPAQDHIDVTLSSAPRVRGKVTDAKTHKPIANFTIVPGVRRSGNQAIAFLPSLSLDVANKNGQYFDTLDGISGDIDAWFIRIEARGYRPALSPALHGPAQQDFALQPGADLRGRILTAGGKPAPGAIVTVALPGQTLYVREGRTFGPDQTAVLTGADGRFDLPAQIGKFVILALSDDGFAQVHQDAIRKSTDIRLSPWGKIQGQLILDGKPAPSQRVAYRQTADAAAPARVFQTAWNMTDSQGRFAFDRIPPGPVQVYQVIEDPLPSGAGANWQVGLSQTLSVAPGQSAEVTLQSN